MDNVDSCDVTVPTAEPATTNVNAAEAIGVEPINAEGPSAPQPTKDRFPWLIVVIGLGLFAFVLFRRGRRR